MPTLHVMLGGGGVGKTTLAAGYALALAESGRRVGLLGIDPSRRLHDALGLELTDREADVPGAQRLRAAILHPHQAIRRWVSEDCETPELIAELEKNPFYNALTDRLASAVDVLAAVRIAEWAERDPTLTDLVVDTAPGVAAVGFLRYPRDVEAVLQGRLVGWLRAAARVSGGGLKALRFGARRILAAMGRIAGIGLVGQLADFFALITAPLQRMVVRLERAQRWLTSEEAELLLVTSPRDAGAEGARQLAHALKVEGLRARAAIVNRAWPEQVERELAAIDLAHAPAGGEATLAHARAYAQAQAIAFVAAAELAPQVVRVPAAPGLYAAEERAVLLSLGRTLERSLSGRERVARGAGRAGMFPR